MKVLLWIVGLLASVRIVVVIWLSIWKLLVLVMRYSVLDLLLLCFAFVIRLHVNILFA